MVPTLLDAVFTRQLKSTIGQPPQVKPMMDIWNLKIQVAD